MAYGMGLRKGSSTRSGFDVGKLKTAKRDVGKRKGVKRISENTGGVEGTTDSVSYGSRHSKGNYDVKYGGKFMESKRSGENEKTKGKSEHREYHPVSRDYDRKIDPVDRKHKVGGRNRLSDAFQRPKNTRISDKVYVESEHREHHPVSRDYDRKIDPVDRKHKVGGRNRLSDAFQRPKNTRISDKVYVEKANDAVEDRKSRGKKHIVELGRESNINSGRASKVTHKKSIQESLTSENQPKRKKRVIQLDPNDISNKRIDDSVSSTDGKVEETDLEISKSAQFRAIKPSSSILSFVDDNLLGRRRTIDLKKAGYNIDLSVPLDNVPFSTNTERDRIEESVFRNKLEFFAAAKVSSSFPPPVLPEIAFAGRSNVGKSSLLNALTRQWGVVRTSDKPGHTQTINFFRLASKLCMVDLPGYGFAYAKEEVKDCWEELVKEYISTRDGLQRVCLLIDTKWGVKPRDHELIELMERSKTPYQIVLTKTDIVFPIDVARRAMQIQEDLKAMKSKVDPVVSSISTCFDDGKLQVRCWHPQPKDGAVEISTVYKTINGK